MNRPTAERLLVPGNVYNDVYDPYNGTIWSAAYVGPMYYPQPAHQYSYPPARYNNTLPPVPWIFRGDVNKPILVLLAMEAPMVLIAIVAYCFGL